MIVGTAGHIDHGKTTLVRALTGVDTDRLEEEKARGISIELGYAYVPLDGGDTLGFVDVPGHERLVHTMVAGACGIDFALLVVAADDGVMPQTREHLAILDLFGVARGAVALTKIDRADETRVAEVRRDIGATLASTSLRDAPIFPVDATEPDDAGVRALFEHLRAAASALPARRGEGFFRLAVDRVFTLAGHGTIVAGTVFSGSIAVGDSVAIMPSGKTARVRALHANHRSAGSGRVGQRCALNLAGIEKSEVQRGDWLADPRALAPTLRIDARLRIRPDATLTLAAWSPLHVHIGTSDRVAHAVPLDADRLAAGESARVQLVFDTPICATAGDRFIVRDARAAATVGGGVVLDPLAPSRKRRSAARLACLDALERMLAGEGIAPLLRQSSHGIALADLERLAGAPVRPAIPDAAQILESERGPFAIESARWRELRERALTALRDFHAQSPDEPGVDASRLRRIAAPDMPDALWRALIRELTHERAIVHSGPWLHAPGHVATLSAREEALARALRPLIAQGRYDPPWVRDLAVAVAAPEDDVRSVLRKLVTRGAVYQIVRDLFYDSARIDELAGVLASLASAHAAVEAHRYRDAIGLGRKRAVQILEFFDRVGYTRRAGDAHVLRRDSAWRDVESPI